MGQTRRPGLCLPCPWSRGRFRRGAGRPDREPFSGHGLSGCRDLCLPWTDRQILRVAPARLRSTRPWHHRSQERSAAQEPTPRSALHHVNEKDPPPALEFHMGIAETRVVAELNNFNRERATCFTDSTANGRIL